MLLPNTNLNKEVTNTFEHETNRGLTIKVQSHLKFVKTVHKYVQQLFLFVHAHGILIQILSNTVIYNISFYLTSSHVTISRVT